MKFRYLIFFILVCSTVSAQHSLNDSLTFRRNRINQKGFMVLSTWAVANIGVALFSTADGERRYFHRMNGYWGGVNLLLAQLGYWSARRNGNNSISFAKNWKQQAALEKVFLFNTALDVAYIAGGLYLREKGKRATGEKNLRLKGYGKSIVLQGAALFLFDGVMYLVHAKNGHQLYSRLENIEVHAGAGGVGLLYRF